MKSFRLAAALTLAILMLTPIAAAHVMMAAGAYTVDVGWANEPAVSHNRNFIVVQVWDTNTELGATGLAGNFTATAHYGTETKTLILVESDETPGSYSVPIEPTKAGNYTIHVEGKIAEGSLVNSDFAIERVVDNAADQFPAEGSNTATLTAKLDALTARIVALEAKAKTESTTPATVTSQTPPTNGGPVPFVGIATIVGIVALAGVLLRRK